MGTSKYGVCSTDASFVCCMLTMKSDLFSNNSGFGMPLQGLVVIVGTNTFTKRIYEKVAWLLSSPSVPSLSYDKVSS